MNAPDEGSAWNDPAVVKLLEDGKAPAEVRLLSCEYCCRYSIDDGGPTFVCPWCEWAAQDKTLETLRAAGEVVSLTEEV